MVVRKILETTLTAGSTTVTFTDSDIPNSLIRTYCTDSDLYPVSLSLSSTTLTITYEAQSTNKGIALEIVKEGLEVIDNLTSTDTNNALSAKQGKVLKDTIDSMSAPALTELSDVNFVSLADGDMIVYDSVSEKFVNQSQPSIPSSITDLDDVNITSIQNGQILIYNSLTEKFENGDESATGGVSYSTSEQDTGLKWVDNRTIYQKTFDLGSDVSISYNGWTTLNDAIIPDLEMIITCFGTNSGGTYTPLQGTYIAFSKTLQVQTPRNGYTQNVRYLTVTYVKSV